MKSKHHIAFRICQSSPLLFICFLALLRVAVTLLIPLKQRIRLGLSTPDHSIRLQEGLPNFFDTIKHQQCHRVLALHDGLKEGFGIEIYDEPVIERLRSCTWRTKQIQRNPFYDIYGKDNKVYVDKYAHVLLHD